MSNIEFLTEKRYTLSAHLIEIAVKNNLSLNEFLLLMYFEDESDKTFNVDKICNSLSLDEEKIMIAFDNLLSKNLMKLDVIKDSSNKLCEEISLEPFYQTVVERKEKKCKAKQKESIFDIFQRELGRNISPMEYEIISTWLEKGFTDDLVVGALQEAVYNGVSSLRYIDKILYEWQKKGYKKMTEVKEGLENKRKESDKNLELFDYNWLEDEG